MRARMISTHTENAIGWASMMAFALSQVENSPAIWPTPVIVKTDEVTTDMMVNTDITSLVLRPVDNTHASLSDHPFNYVAPGKLGTLREFRLDLADHTFRLGLIEGF